MEADQKKQLALKFVVLHLNDQDQAIVLGNTRAARENIKDSIEDYFSGMETGVGLIGPAQISDEESTRRVDSAEWTTLQLDAVHLETNHADRNLIMHFGLGNLAELVNLYNLRRDDLFSKNIRYYIQKKSNVERGPAGKIRETLRQICIEESGISPEVFAFYHNGVTLFARAVESTEAGLRVRDPFVLNGCQTIKTAFFFQTDARLNKRIDPKRWERIKLPLRIITTRDENLINTITINNNRQNSISYAALRANDPVQIELEERFRAAKIFYQRQEGAYANLEDSNPEVLEDEYENSRGDYVEIVDLARSLAAVAGEFELATSPSHIFENETAYKRCFSEKRLTSAVFLTFLQNLHDVIFLVVKKDLDLEPSVQGPRPSRVGYYAMCLFVRYLAKEEMTDKVDEFGHALWGRSNQFREWVGKVLDNYHSGIKGVLQSKFMTLPDSKAETLKDAFATAESVLRLRDNIDPFDVFKQLRDTGLAD